MRPIVWLTAVLTCAALSGCSRQPTVVLYTSVDQVFAEEIVPRFEKESGIRVALVTDTEATKTVGLVQRLMAERQRPQADVFWNNEILNTALLAKEGVLTAYRSPGVDGIPDEWVGADGLWTGFALRARVIVYNTDKVSAGDAPRSIFDLVGPRWRGKVAMANPLFGTTFSHAAALVQQMGVERAREFFLALKDNDVMIVDGNSVVRDKVALGEAWVGLTDTDDVFVGQAKGWKLGMIVPDQKGMGACLIPNTVALVNGAPHRAEGKRLIDFLLSAEVERLLAESESHNTPVRSAVHGPEIAQALIGVQPMSVDWPAAAAEVPKVREMLEEVFLK